MAADALAVTSVVVCCFLHGFLDIILPVLSSSTRWTQNARINARQDLAWRWRVKQWIVSPLISSALPFGCRCPVSTTDSPPVQRMHTECNRNTDKTSFDEDAQLTTMLRMKQGEINQFEVFVTKLCDGNLKQCKMNEQIYSIIDQLQRLGNMRVFNDTLNTVLF